jgi:hypothetical protein
MEMGEKKIKKKVTRLDGFMQKLWRGEKKIKKKINTA